MKEIQLKDDLTLICSKAKEFPGGVVPAYQFLEQKVGTQRQFYGLSRGDKTGISYWACVLANNGEMLPAGCERITVNSGTYISEQISNWRGREAIIGEAFQRMLGDSRIDRAGYCVEKYLDNDDVICMVRIIPNA
jgi:predicted transcriptional regulator YdeE